MLEKHYVTLRNKFDKHKLHKLLPEKLVDVPPDSVVFTFEFICLDDGTVSYNINTIQIMELTVELANEIVDAERDAAAAADAAKAAADADKATAAAAASAAGLGAGALGALHPDAKTFLSTEISKYVEYFKQSCTLSSKDMVEQVYTWQEKIRKYKHSPNDIINLSSDRNSIVMQQLQTELSTIDDAKEDSEIIMHIFKIIITMLLEKDEQKLCVQMYETMKNNLDELKGAAQSRQVRTFLLITYLFRLLYLSEGYSKLCNATPDNEGLPRHSVKRMYFSDFKDHFKRLPNELDKELPENQNVNEYFKTGKMDTHALGVLADIFLCLEQSETLMQRKQELFDT